MSRALLAVLFVFPFALAGCSGDADTSDGEGGGIGWANDTETAADREKAEAFFAQQHANDELRNVRWTGQPLYLAIMAPEDLSGLSSKEVVSEQEAAEYLRELNANLEDLEGVPPSAIVELKRIGTVFTVEYEGNLYGSEKSATETIEVKYEGYQLTAQPGPGGESELRFDHGPTRSVRSTGTKMREL